MTHQTDPDEQGRSLFLQAQAARQEGRNAEAEALLRRALVYAPGRESLRTNLCGALIDQGKHAEALPLCEALVADFPTSVVAWHRLSLCQFATGQLDASLASIERCLALAPDNRDARLQHVATLLRLHLTDAALHACSEALRAHPQDAELLTAQGVVHGARRAFVEARDCHERALDLAPGDADKQWNLALAQLMLGDYRDGWANMEARWTKTDPAELLYEGSAPRWDGRALGPGTRVVVWGEQGLGDVLHFCRFVPALARVGGQVIFQVPAPLVRLMRSLDDSVLYAAEGDGLPAHDFHLPLLSLPRFVCTDEARLLPPARLSAPHQAQLAWQARLGTRGRPRVGLMWQGNLANAAGRHRSMPLAALQTLFSLPLDFYCVSDRLAAEDAEWLNAHGAPLRGFAGVIGDFADTAALLMQLDLIISIDTSIAHLGPAVGVTTWVMLAQSADWRWGTGERSPWYPQSRLFRQAVPGDWQPVVATVREALVRHFMPG